MTIPFQVSIKEEINDYVQFHSLIHAQPLTFISAKNIKLIHNYNGAK